MRTPWTDKDDVFLKIYYETKERKFILSHFPYKTWAAIKARAQRLYLNRAKYVLRLWTKDEEQLLEDIYPQWNWEMIFSSFPNRTKQQIYDKAHKINLHRKDRHPTILEKSGLYLTCKNCQKIYYQPPSRIDRQFCSRKCSAEYLSGEYASNWKDGKSLEQYPPAFNELFKCMIRERDNYTCALCGKWGNCVHHINAVKNDTVPENCVTLCRSCHTRIHNTDSLFMLF